MGLFSKKIGPVFCKETSDSSIFISKMQMLLEKTDGEIRKKIEKQINMARYGEIGENNIAYELQNSGMDMYILHDVYFEINGLSAQIDYIVITRQHIYVIECKNLIGNIEVDNSGAFIRTYEIAGRRMKEGIYSPITQNQRHMQVLKEVRLSAKGNFISKMLFEKHFAETYKPIVVLANPKTYINYKYAKKEIKDQIIRADQLIAYIKRQDAESAASTGNMSTDEMLRLARFYLLKDNPMRSDYARKYEELVRETAAHVQKEKNVVSQSVPAVPVLVKETPSSNADREELVRKLKAFRLEQSRKEKIKPYYIFNDAQMTDLIARAPQTREELLQISGFGNVKVEKYGAAILEILQK
ncbi:MAG: NERD domain-containing protein [Lachnospiraceae bacterium]